MYVPNSGSLPWNAGSFAVISGLSARQSQLILVENRAECRSSRFRMQVVTPTFSEKVRLKILFTYLRFSRSMNLAI